MELKMTVTMNEKYNSPMWYPNHRTRKKNYWWYICLILFRTWYFLFLGVITKEMLQMRKTELAFLLLPLALK